MNNKQLALILVPIFIIVFLMSFFIMKNNVKEKKTNIEEPKVKEEVKAEFKVEENDMKAVIVIVNGKELVINLENNSSSEAFYNKLLEGEVIVDAHDYGNFEKVGDLGFDLPRNDKQITTVPGDLILYMGNQITLYYDTNTWNFTKLGHIDINKDELKEILGNENVTMTFKLK